MNEIYISVDLETSGSNPVRHSILSIGAVVCHHHEHRYYAELQPLSYREVDPNALLVNNLDVDQLRDYGLPPSKAIQQFANWVRAVRKYFSTGWPEPSVIFVGFNATFDYRFLVDYFDLYEVKNPFGYAPCDVKSMYFAAKGCTWKETKANAIFAEVKHDALADAVAQAKLFELLRGDSPKTSVAKPPASGPRIIHKAGLPPRRKDEAEPEWEAGGYIPV